MKASDYIAAFLAENGVKHVFEMCGGMTTHLLDSLYRDGRVEIVSVHHEQAAAFAAEADARISGTVSVAMATSGPGATNLLTGIGSCYYDSVPVVFITGQVNAFEQRSEGGVRQSGFQETDIVEMARPITKDAWRINDAAEIPRVFREAFAVAREGRPGPVLIDIAMNAQRDELEADSLRTVAVPCRVRPSKGEVRAVLDAIQKADRPVLLVGGGVRSAGAVDALRRFLALSEVPVVCSLMGLDVLPFDDPARAGMIGTYGNRWANVVLGEADLIVALGSRLDIRQTGANVKQFTHGKVIARIDVDPIEIDWRITPDIRVEADIAEFLDAALERLSAQGGEARDRSEWLATTAALRLNWPDEDELSDQPGINPAKLMHLLSDAGSGVAAFIADVGQNQMWAAQSLRLRGDQRFLTSGGMGAMGFALPAAIGAAFARPPLPVVAISGDGGMQVNIQELETVARQGLPVKCVVLDNGCLGMVRQFQDEYMEARHQSTVWGYGAPDFAEVARAYGIAARTVSEPDELSEAVAWLFRDSQPALLHVRIHSGSVVRPKVAYGNAVHVMEPPPSAHDRGSQDY